MNPPVGGKVGTAAEALPAFLAGEGLLPRVDTAVYSQMRPAPKTLTAHRAREGFFTRVDLLVSDAVRVVGEDLATLSADVGFPHCVGVLMLDTVLPGGELLAAFTACIELYVDVRSQVHGQVGVVTETHATLGTGEHSLAFVGHLVQDEHRTSGKAFTALRAYNRRSFLSHGGASLEF